MLKKAFKGLSNRAKILLGRPEGMEVEFKQTAAALDASDIVAFANSKTGGTILIGIKEERASNGQTIVKPVGCPTGDVARLQVLDKAMSCVPPVPVEIFVENTNSVTFLRLEIPASSDRPYCTNGGTYKVREDGRVRALHPRDLLNMLVEKEARLFEERFAQATSTLIAEIQSTANSVAGLNTTISSEIEDIASILGWADTKVEETASDIRGTKALTASVLAQVGRSNRRLVALLKGGSVSDPIKEEARSHLLEELVKEFKLKPELLENWKEGTSAEVSLQGGDVELFSREEIVELILEAAKKVRLGET